MNFQRTTRIFVVHVLSLTQEINTGTVSVILPRYLDSVNTRSMIYGVERRPIPSLLQGNHLGIVDFHLFNTLEIIAHSNLNAMGWRKYLLI